MGNTWWTTMPWGWMMVGWLFMLLFWGGVIALVVWVVLRLTRRKEREAEPTPLDVLKMRYARGEITKAEFDQRKADLQ